MSLVPVEKRMHTGSWQVVGTRAGRVNGAARGERYLHLQCTPLRILEKETLNTCTVSELAEHIRAKRAWPGAKVCTARGQLKG